MKKKTILPILLTLLALSACAAPEKDTATETSETSTTQIPLEDFEAQAAAEAAAAAAAEAEAQAAREAAEEAARIAAEEEAKARIREIQGVRCISLYRNDRSIGQRVRMSEFTSAWVKGQDILSLEAYATDEESFPLSVGAGQALMDKWNGYWNAWEGSENCKIGFIVDFTLQDGTSIHQVIRKPEDVLGYRPYLENYLYDDVHQVPGAWYSHLETTDVDEETVITSIKFTAGQEYEQIQGNIVVTVFVYNSDEDFDENGEYKGDVSASVTLING